MVRLTSRPNPLQFSRSVRRAVVALLVAAGASPTVHAQFSTGFESPQYNGSPGGTLLPGQNGWFTPSGGAFNVHTYSGNPYGFVQNPFGDDQFIAGQSAANPARGQVGVTFSNTTITISYDTNLLFNGSLPTLPTGGSFSLQHNTLAAGTFQDFTNVFNFTTPADPSLGWRSAFTAFSAAGAQMTLLSPGAFWDNLQYNHWYRSEVTVDFAAHKITTVSLMDLHTSQSASVNPVDWYLRGGANSALALPDAIRVFAGGNAGNISGWDNISVVPAPGALALLGLAGLTSGRRRRRS
ncbi:MAG: PEP-CTERM sorting domain-containing protein [Phycisphaerales bacterium]|nr:PEP-CTERM sorting domain-containing protein [Phycisphaerales bacterium]